MDKHNLKDRVPTDKDNSKRWDYVFRAERWKGEDFIITVLGKPIGHCLSLTDAIRVKDWLTTAAEDLFG